MAKDEETSGNEIVSLQAWKDKKNLQVAKPRKAIKINLNCANAELLGRLEKVKKKMGNKTDLEVFLRGLDILDQYLELSVNGGKLYLIYEGDDESAMEFDFE